MTSSPLAPSSFQATNLSAVLMFSELTLDVLAGDAGCNPEGQC